jgi:hypothetical protein
MYQQVHALLDFSGVIEEQEEGDCVGISKSLMFALSDESFSFHETLQVRPCRDRRSARSLLCSNPFLVSVWCCLQPIPTMVFHLDIQLS